MPITRRDDSVDPLDPYILLLWQKKWLIVALAIIAAILVYIALLFVPSKYKVTAEIFVNRLATVETGATANSDTVISLLESSSVIERVRDDYAEEFDVPKPELERFAKQFDVESYVLQDTTVRKELSPVLTLKVESGGTSETRFIMESWINNFISEFGNYSVKEAVIKRDALIKEKKSLDTRIAEGERIQAEIEARMPFLRKMLAEKLDLLSPSRLETDRGNMTVDFNVRAPRMNPGLFEQHADVLMKIKTGTASTTAELELKAIESSIADAKTSVAAMQKELSDAIFKQTNNNRKLELLKKLQTSVSEAVNRFTIAATAYRTPVIGELPMAGDIRALSMPVTPEVRVWPKRTISAAVAAVAVAIISMFIILAQSFLARVTASTRK